MDLFPPQLTFADTLHRASLPLNSNRPVPCARTTDRLGKYPHVRLLSSGFLCTSL